MNALCSPRSQFICRLAMLTQHYTFYCCFPFQTVSWCEMHVKNDEKEMEKFNETSTLCITQLSHRHESSYVSHCLPKRITAIRIYLFCAYISFYSVSGFYSSQHFCIFLSFHTFCHFIVESNKKKKTSNNWWWGFCCANTFYGIDEK